MATILGTVTLDEIKLLEVDVNPGAGAGTPAPTGSLALTVTGQSIYKKFGAADTDWIDVSSASSASPGFTWGRSGNVSPNAWLTNDSVPSNISGRVNFLTGAIIKRVFVANETAVVFSVGVYYHEGNEVNLTLAGTVTTTAQRTNTFTTNFSIPDGKQIALRITSGSAKNVTSGVIISGSLS